MKPEIFKLMGWDDDKIANYIGQNIKLHDTQYKSFQVNVPKFPDPNCRGEKESFSCNGPLGTWYRYNQNDIDRNGVLKRIYTDLKNNFTYEVTGYNDKEDFTDIWLLRASTLKPKCVPSEDYYCTGIACFTDQIEECPTLTFAWIHPYMRRNNILFYLLKYIMLNDGFFTVEPPITEPMQKLMQKLCAEALEQPKTYCVWIAQSIKKSEKKFPIIAKCLEKDNIDTKFKVLGSMNAFDEVIKAYGPSTPEQRQEIFLELNNAMKKMTPEEIKELDFPEFDIPLGDIMNLNTFNEKIKKKCGR